MLDLKEQILELNAELIEIRRHLHINPELGYQEYNTAKYIENYLNKLGIENSRNSQTGVIGLIKGMKPGKTLLLRADIDALPVKEDTGLEYSSKVSGLMHACGHDGHTAILLICAKILSTMKDKIKGNVKLVFQPNEEESGALNMIEQGALENPSVDGAFALHLWTPIESGYIGLNKGAVLGTTEEFELEIIGRSGHTSTPHTAIDPLLPACEIVQSIQTIQTREIDPLIPIAIMFGYISGGTGRNIIAQSIKLGGTIRFLSNTEKQSKEFILGRFEEIIGDLCKVHRLSYNLKFIPSNSSVLNDDKMTELARKSIVEMFGNDDKIVSHICLAGEDFAEFTHRTPSCFAFIGTGNKDKKTDFPHHHPKFNIDEDTLKIGVEYLVRNTLNYFESE